MSLYDFISHVAVNFEDVGPLVTLHPLVIDFTACDGAIRVYAIPLFLLLSVLVSMVF